MRSLAFVTLIGSLLFTGASATGQIAIIRNSLPSDRTTGFKVSQVEVNADIRDQVTNVQLAQTFQNVSGRTLETQFVFPLPADAAIKGLTLIVDGKELTGELKPKGEARQIYEEIVRRQKDPALLEFVDHGVFRTSVFPVPAGKSRRVEIRYSQLLKSDSGLVDFSLPLGAARHCTHPIDAMTVKVRIRSANTLKNVYSPSHDFTIERPSPNKAVCELILANVRKPDDVRLLYGTRGSDVGMDLISYKPEGDEQGYFLLLATPKMKTRKDQALPKTVVFVVDRSGSMAGEKLNQAKASLKYMVNSLGPKDTFNIVSYSSEVDVFRSELELVTSETKSKAQGYIEDLYSGGGTNIEGALTTALDLLQDTNRPTYVLFFTDGRPTVGLTNESDIALRAKESNKVGCRLFNFGVGFDVNSRLLDRLSEGHRGISVYVKPDEDVEVVATNLFRKVSSPAMTDLKIEFTSDSVPTDGALVNRIYPRDMPDLFFGEQLVLVGRYRHSGEIAVSLKGDVGERQRRLSLDSRFGTSRSTRANGFVEELWATRRIGQIIDELDLNGQNSELVDELVALSLRHGIMTPYTSFLAEEENSLGDRERWLSEARTRTIEGLSVSGGRSGFLQRDFKKQLQEAPRASLHSFSRPETESLESSSIAKGGRRSRSLQPPAGAFGGVGGGGVGVAPADGSNSRFFGGVVSDDSSVRRERIRRVGGKTFYWKNGEWQDSEYARVEKSTKPDSILQLKRFSRDYFEFAASENGRWAKCLAFDEPVLLVVKGKVYRVIKEEDSAADTE